MNFKTAIATVGLSVVSFLASSAHAGTGSGRISATAVETATDRVKIYVYGTHSSKPACATSGNFGLDISTNKGKAIYNAIIAAALAGRVVEVVGDGACGAVSGAETITKITFWTDDF